jgi:signal transduction histidine kinase
MRYFYSLLLVLFLVNANAQNPYAQVPKSLDSLKLFLKTKPRDTTYVIALGEYAFIVVKNGKYAEAKKCVDQMQQLSNKYHYGLGFYKTTNMRGVIEYSQSNSGKAMEYFLECTKIIAKHKLPKKTYQNCLNNISIIYNQMGDRENATAYAIKLIDYQEKYRLNPLKSSPYDQIGMNLKFFKKYGEALPYFKRALEIETANKNFTGMAIAENNLGNLYDDLEKNKEAIKHYEKGLAYAEKDNYKLLQTDLMINSARLYKNEHNFKTALNYLKKSEAICLELDATPSLKIVYQNFGDLYFEQKNYPLAEQNYLKSLALAKQIEDPELLYSANQALADLKQETANFKEAYFYKVAAETYKDSTFKIETAQNTENLLRKYETKKKQQEIIVLVAKDKINNLEIENAGRQRILFIIGLVLLFIAVGSLVIIYRNKQKSAQILEQKNHEMNLLNVKLDKANTTKATLFSIIGHDLRSPISHIYQFLDLQKSEPELFSEADKIRHNERITNAASTVLETMEDLLIWSKSQMQQFTVSVEKIPVLPAIESIIGLMQTQIDNKKIEVVTEIDASETLHSDRNIFTIIIRNLLQNAVKYSPENTTVTISAQNLNGKTQIKIADQGNGMPQSVKSIFNDTSAHIDSGQSGLGITLVKEMGELVGASFAISDNLPKGTVVLVTFSESH